MRRLTWANGGWGNRSTTGPRPLPRHCRGQVGRCQSTYSGPGGTGTWSGTPRAVSLKPAQAPAWGSGGTPSPSIGTARACPPASRSRRWAMAGLVTGRALPERCPRGPVRRRTSIAVDPSRALRERCRRMPDRLPATRSARPALRLARRCHPRHPHAFFELPGKRPRPSSRSSTRSAGPPRVSDIDGSTISARPRRVA